MTEPESLWVREGGVKLPVESVDIDGTKLSFGATDPALDAIAALCAAALRAELGTGTTSAWYTVTGALPSTHRLYRSTNPVGSVWKVEPTSTVVRQVKASWPLLAVWRDGAAIIEQRTIMKAQSRQKWSVMWSLGDIEADLGLKVAPVLNLAGMIIERTVALGRHPNHDSNAIQFDGEAGHGWLSNIVPVERQAGQARFTDDEESRFWAASVTFESTELVRELDEGSDGGDLTLALSAGDGLELVPEMIVGDGDYPGT